MVALAERVVEVISDFGPSASPRYRYGSGCVVSGRTVLTAAHAVMGAETVWIRGRDKRRREAHVDPLHVGDPESVDLALIELDEDTGFPALMAAAVDRSSAVPEVIDRCHTVGYPAFKERTTQGSAVRDTVGVGGHISVLASLVSDMLTLQVTASPRSLPQHGQPLAQSSGPVCRAHPCGPASTSSESSRSTPPERERRRSRSHPSHTSNGWTTPRSGGRSWAWRAWPA
ncbi:trypsin-like peptidase domain-containing protein [Streptomyces chartreusis]|uniref:trypsin-like peptidase domain-containing protein n=1 Tax=Streptomyces chartreusis TaxID=1969 RepID=UPI003651631E